MRTIKSIAVIGAGPAGAITVDALAQEKAFDVIKVFERREKAGGCWLEDPLGHVQQLPDLKKIAERNPDPTLPIPRELPAKTPKSRQYRFTETSMYPYLHSNIDATAMAFSQEPIPEIRSEWSIEKHGPDTPFRFWKVIEKYIADLLNRNGYNNLVNYNTTVELVSKIPETGKWRLVLRRLEPDGQHDFWWSEDFDAVIVASGHFAVPYIPHTPGLAEFMAAYPGSVEHTKSYRGREKYSGKRVVVVGASISGADASFDLVNVAKHPIYSVVRGNYHPYFGDWAFRNSNIQRRPPITRIDCSNGARTVHFSDGSFVENVDHILFGTGYSWTLPFLPSKHAQIRNNRVPNLYLHIFDMQDPSLCFVGAISPGLTFKAYEWQAVLAARFLAGRAQLPDVNEQRRWEEVRVREKGDGVKFTALYPRFEEYFEEVRRLAGEPVVMGGKGVCGRRLPRWDPGWLERFNDGHERRIRMWRRENRGAVAGGPAGTRALASL